MNQAAAEVGLDPISDPYSSAEKHFVQMRYLLQTAGEELALAYPWEFLNKTHQITTSSSDSGDYDLPEDFYYMIPENVPLFGPLSAQDWTYLLGRDLVTYTIYASFRIKKGKFSIFPQPPPNGLDINFEYQSRSWVIPANSPGTPSAQITNGSDVVLYDKTLVSRYLRVKWLIAKGFDTSKAQDDFDQIFNFITGKDKSGEILSVGRNGRQFPYLDGRYNTPDKGYGGVV
jgi:hypothetical protein